MKYLVTGGTGFLGSYVTKQLLALNHEIVCYDYTPNMNAIQEVLSKEELENVKIECGDICDFEQILEVCKREKIGRIIHLAGFLKSACEEQVLKAVRTNVLGTANIFEAARILGIKRVVYASSIDSIGNPDCKAGEIVSNDVPHDPVNLYGKFKDMCEFLGKHYNNTFGLETIGMRYVIIYGKARIRGGSNWIMELINKPALNQSSCVPFGDAQPDMIYVKDAANATVLATLAQSEKLTQEAYTITGDVKSVREMRDYVLSLLPNVEIGIEPGELELKVQYDGSAAAKDLGYKAEYSCFEGISETINLIRVENKLEQIL